MHDLTEEQIYRLIRADWIRRNQPRRHRRPLHRRRPIVRWWR